MEKIEKPNKLVLGTSYLGPKPAALDINEERI